MQMLRGWCEMKGIQSEVRLYLEEAPGRSLRPIARDNILIFLKLYNPHTKHLSYLGKHFVRKTNKVPDLMPLVNKLANFPDNIHMQVGLAKQNTTVVYHAVRQAQILCEPTYASAPMVVASRCLVLYLFYLHFLSLGPNRGVNRH